MSKNYVFIGFITNKHLIILLFCLIKICKTLNFWNAISSSGN